MTERRAPMERILGIGGPAAEDDPEDRDGGQAQDEEQADGALGHPELELIGPDADGLAQGQEAKGQQGRGHDQDRGQVEEETCRR